MERFWNSENSILYLGIIKNQLVMENQIYDFIVENLGLNGWDHYTCLSPEEQKDFLEELGFEGE